ncbi:MAG: O-acetyl-ADP-ribose deacetylase, partial [Saprospiraceae bacterium]|nr:O-acetyl-ADP-ribose deacetylase [Saprospiraceae bacterium]
MIAIELVHGDITKMHVDAIVNAANAGLRGGGGVDGAIHAAGGPEIMSACREIIASRGVLSTGEAVITTGGRLPCRAVIHTVGPVYDGSRPQEMARLLAACYTNSLEVAAKHEMMSIAFPNISTGVYGYPKPEAAAVAVRSVQAWLAAGSGLRKICYVCFDRENYDIYRS